MTNKEYIATSFFITNAMFLGIGFSSIYNYTDKDSWLSIIIGFLLGLIIIIILDKISKKVNYNLEAYIDKLKNKLIPKLLLIILYMIYAIFIIVVFANFIKSFYLYNTPIIIIIIPLLLLALYLSIKEEKVIGKISEALFFLVILFIFNNFVLLGPKVNIDYFLPIMTTSFPKIMISSFLFLVFSSCPNILLLNQKVSLKTKIKGYLFGTLALFLINFFITSVLGPYYIKIYSYPEYMVLKKIKFLNFAENIEKLVSLLWYVEIFIFLSLSLKKLSIINKKKIFFSFFVILIFIIAYLFAQNYFYLIDLFNYSAYLIFIIFILIIISLIIFKKKKD